MLRAQSDILASAFQTTISMLTTVFPDTGRSKLGMYGIEDKVAKGEMY